MASDIGTEWVVVGQLYYQRNGAKLDQFHNIVPRYSRQLSLDREPTVWIKLFLGPGMTGRRTTAHSTPLALR